MGAVIDGKLNLHSLFFLPLPPSLPSYIHTKEHAVWLDPWSGGCSNCVSLYTWLQETLGCGGVTLRYVGKSKLLPYVYPSLPLLISLSSLLFSLLCFYSRSQVFLCGIFCLCLRKPRQIVRYVTQLHVRPVKCWSFAYKCRYVVTCMDTYQVERRLEINGNKQHSRVYVILAHLMCHGNRSIYGKPAPCSNQLGSRWRLWPGMQVEY